MSTNPERATALAILVNKGNSNAVDRTGGYNATQQVFVLKGKTRQIVYPYAHRSPKGSISFHVMSPMLVNDSAERNLSYRSKPVWVSVNTDSQVDKSNPNKFYNNNIGLFNEMLKHNIVEGDKTIPNPHNSLLLHSVKYRLHLVPNNLDTMSIQKLEEIRTPFKTLNMQMKKNRAANLAAGGTEASLNEMNAAAYQNYINQTMELFDKGDLILATIYTNPEQDTITPIKSALITMESIVDPWYNGTKLMQRQPVSNIPTLNQFSGVLTITNADMSAMLSDNVNMFGKREFSFQNTDQKGYALTKVGILKTSNSIDIPVLVSIVDVYNNNPNARSRVETFESHLAKGNDTFMVFGKSRPVVRLEKTSANRVGNVIIEITIDNYLIHNINSLNDSVDTDVLSLHDSELDDIMITLSDENVDSIGVVHETNLIAMPNSNSTSDETVSSADDMTQYT